MADGMPAAPEVPLLLNCATCNTAALIPFQASKKGKGARSWAPAVVPSLGAVGWGLTASRDESGRWCMTVCCPACAALIAPGSVEHLLGRAPSLAKPPTATILAMKRVRNVLGGVLMGQGASVLSAAARAGQALQILDEAIEQAEASDVPSPSATGGSHD